VRHVSLGQDAVQHHHGDIATVAPCDQLPQSRLDKRFCNESSAHLQFPLVLSMPWQAISTGTPVFYSNQAFLRERLSTRRDNDFIHYSYNLPGFLVESPLS
jgi:hypothetical protein